MSFHSLFRPDIWPSFSSHFYSLLTFSAIFVQFHSFDLNTVFLFMSFQCIHLFHFIHVILVIYSLISFTRPCFSFHIYSLLTFSAFFVQFSSFRSETRLSFSYHFFYSISVISFIHSFSAPERSDSSIVDILMYFTYLVPYAVTKQWNL